MRKAVTISPVRQNHLPRTVNEPGENVRERQPPLFIKQAFVGHKKSPLFIRADNRDSPDRTNVQIVLTGANVGIKI